MSTDEYGGRRTSWWCIGPRAGFVCSCMVFFLMLIISILQIGFFVLLPDLTLHPSSCLASNHQWLMASDPTGPPWTSPEFHQPPMKLFYQSLYLPPEDMAYMQRKRRLLSASSSSDAAYNAQQASPFGNDVMRQHLGQGHERMDSNATYCINVITPFNAGGVALDFELYLDALPSSRPVYGFESPTVVPASIVDLYLERHPVDKKYYKNFHFAPHKTIWMMQNVEFFDRHELDNPRVGVIVVKNRIGLKKVLEYRHRHGLEYTVFYAKHTSRDLFDPQLASKRDWNSFLHLAGQSPFKNSRVILLAWARHPEWPKLIMRATEPKLCAWIRETFGQSGPLERNLNQPNDEPPKPWQLANVDFRCQSESVERRVALQNRIGLHLCPSQTEGFGHYINEARSVGALIVTTNVPPMNELVDHMQSGLLVGQAKPWWWQTKGDVYMPLAHIEVEEMEATIEQILQLSIPQRQAMGRQARARFLEDRTYFYNAMNALEQSLCRPEGLQVERLLPYLY